MTIAFIPDPNKPVRECPPWRENRYALKTGLPPFCSRALTNCPHWLTDPPNVCSQLGTIDGETIVLFPRTG